MKRLILIVLLAIASARSADTQAATKQPQTVLIHRPTIVAFFLPITEAEANSGEGDAEALSDFNYYLYMVRKRLESAGVEIQEVSERSFQIQDGTKTRAFETGKVGIGYYLIAPGREPHVEYGVMTDEDLLETAQTYFGIAIPKDNCTAPHCSK
jgi:hypothetical protein